MRKIILLLSIAFSALTGYSQEQNLNSLSTSFVRLEKMSSNMNGAFYLKFITGLEYQRQLNKWSFGVRLEHGFNKFEESGENCYDCFYGTSYLRESNAFLTSNYALLSLFDSKLKLNTGLGFYYTNRNQTANLQGGISGGGLRINSNFNLLGFAPSLSVVYFPIPRLFISLNATTRFGWGKELDVENNQVNTVRENVVTAPELRIGVRF
jgi:hypothetical protein